ncbi:LOW QUALITY PROTEIN: NLR family CARD domain-containing protein 3-like [Xyrichtys novacula]|uniref:LOW QUALITY PROTEIN: NLR family CARD domain-containing protein 3-like n=1 Tax=Xyrichtys novacula TaxID=13765 RepID=A0AAV1FP26_XYRNO|nr:LOW QUALITY PROTEIN: NLR family CARD domain-containing protein 3-like [Xyrichtys novacula]
MTSAQQLIQSHRDLLLNWTRDHPAPLLRWLRDDGVLSYAQYLSLLEKSSANAVAQTLETVCATEESSLKFLQVLKEVQEYYCKDLQVWVERHCRNDAISKPESTPVQVGGKKPKGLFGGLFAGKSKSYTLTSEVTAKEKLKASRRSKVANIRAANIRAAISAHKTTILKRTGQLKCYSEGEGPASNSASHIEIRYTELFVTEDDEFVDSSQHEYFDLASRRARIYVHQSCQRIRLCNLLSSPEGTEKILRVKVKGIAGIGKSVAVQRLLYEWAIGKNMSEFTCLFDLRFRELNLIEEPLSLLELLGERFRYLKEALPNLFSTPSSLLFILDGLDEFKFPLDWSRPRKDIGIESKVPISELMVALITGTLLKGASVILTTRPSTEAPKDVFHRCCVVLGFEEDQVKEYTNRFYKDSQVADRVYEYILNNDNIFVLSFIPLYCYIICTAMVEFFSKENQDIGDSESLQLNPPRTVSEVYFCYLFTAVKHHALRGNAERNTPRSEILSLVKQQLINLGKLAYENLLQKKIIFQSSDLEKYGVTPADLQSTFLCNVLQPIKEETGEMFSFFHLTVQEHLAAVYCAIHLSSQDDIIQALDFWCTEKHPTSSITAPLCDHSLNMDKVEGLQMFTRFFMGTLRARLAGQLDGLVLTPMEEEDGISARLGLWFRDQFKGKRLENQTALNLLHCLMEFHNKETSSMVAPEIKTLYLFKMKLSVVDCAAMHYVLQFSLHKLKELNVGYSNIGNRGLTRLGPILHRCESLYMCGNNLGPEGVLELWKALEHNTTVEELYLDITGITEQGTENIVKCLSKNTSLKTLTIVGNDIGEVGRRRLKELEQNRPGLCIIANFVDDLGLLQAYLDWVEEIRVDRDQMDSVKNADALQSVLKGLQVAGGRAAKRENAEKAKELETKILDLLKSHTNLIGGR